MKIEFTEKLNFIIGNNGVGKTNILEGITVAANIKSFRNISDIDIIRWGESSYFCSAETDEEGSRKFEVGCAVQDGSVRKKLKINGADIKRANEYFGKLQVVIFTPLDINIINGAPDQRRRFFDSVLSKLDIGYFNDLNEFKKILSSRNRLLRDMGFRKTADKTNLETWDIMFSRKAAAILKKRYAFIEEYSGIFRESYGGISGRDSAPEIIYSSTIEDFTEESILAKLNSMAGRDISMGSTGIGPQRDDFLFLQNGRPVTSIASQGQRRTAAISLKITEMKMIEKAQGGKCVILIDDIFSELDESRRHNMISMFSAGNQVIFTMVNSNIFHENCFNDYRSYLIDDEGRVHLH